MEDRTADRALQNLLAQGLGRETGLAPERCDEIAFHLVDWKDDLARLASVLEAPEAHSAEQRLQVIMAFLIHATPHCMAAHELLMDFPARNIFKEQDGQA